MKIESDPLRTISTQGIVAIEAATLVIAPTLREPLGEPEPGRIAGGQCQNRPIAAVDHAVRTELLHHVRRIRHEIRLAPPGGGRLGHETRDLAPDIRTFREVGDVGAPWVEQPVADGWL